MVKKNPWAQVVVRVTNSVGNMAYSVGEKPLLLCGISASAEDWDGSRCGTGPAGPWRGDHLGGTTNE